MKPFYYSPAFWWPWVLVVVLWALARWVISYFAS